MVTEVSLWANMNVTLAVFHPEVVSCGFVHSSRMCLRSSLQKTDTDSRLLTGEHDKDIARYSKQH